MSASSLGVGAVVAACALLGLPEGGGLVECTGADGGEVAAVCQTVADLAQEVGRYDNDNGEDDDDGGEEKTE